MREDRETVFHDMVGQSESLAQIIKRVQDVAPLDIPVLILGESGVGKELIARAIHKESKRRRGPFHAVNCGAVPRELVSSELFGHEKGAFTGASNPREGLFEAADGGTLFLDEIATMDSDMQVSLLRVLETRNYARIGSSDQRHADVRILAATNGDPSGDLQDIRRDLYYRLNVFAIKVPPLRGRPSDVPVLANHFLTIVGRRLGINPGNITPAAMRQLKAYGWPGNVRELKSVITRAMVLASGEPISEDHVVEALYQRPLVEESPPATRSDDESSSTEAGESPEDATTIHVGQSIDEAERSLIRLTLNHVDGNRTEAAKLLGITRKSLYNKMKRYGIES